MCGHVGIAGKLETKDENTMKRLLVLDVFRGPDSTGIATLKSATNEVKIAKVASHPLDLFEMKKFTEALNGWASTVFLGHNRLATKGAVNGVNAHPFQFGHIVGAHNGTLDRAAWTELEEKIGEKFDVDSQAIFAGIAHLGVEETIKTLRGAWALVWIDLQEGTLNFLRNKERPFWYAYTENFDRVFWASEWPMIDAAVNLAPKASAYKLFADDAGYRFFQTKENWHYRFKLEDLKKGNTDRPKPKVKEIKGKEPLPAVNYTCGVSPFQHRGPHNRTGTTSHGKTTSTTHSHGTTGGGQTPANLKKVLESRKKKVDVINLIGSQAKPLAGYLTQEKFDEMAKHGCGWCGSDVDFFDVGVTILENQGAVLCPTCSGNTTHSHIYVSPSKLALQEGK